MAAIEIRPPAVQNFGDNFDLASISCCHAGRSSRFLNSLDDGYQSRKISMALRTFIRIIDKTSGHRQGAVNHRVDAIAQDAEVRN
jgi:hypothetical protein